MPCRVGITTNPDERQKYWQNQVVGLTNWRILTSYENSSEAQAFETEFAKVHGCQVSPDGADAPGIWYVYHFEYTITR